MSLLVLTSDDVEAIICAFQSQNLQLIMAKVFSRFSLLEKKSYSDKSIDFLPDISMPERLSIATANHTALFMPARIGSHNPASLGDTAVKVVCVSKEGSSRGLPSSTLVINEETGSIKAIVNSRKLTAIRNAAGSLLSTCLMKCFQPQSIVAFGAGQQIEAHLDLHIQHFYSIKRCTIINRSRNNRALQLEKNIKTRFPHVECNLLAASSDSSDTARRTEALRSADLIICATSSATPLFSSDHVKTGTHIILIGSYTPQMQEVDGNLIRRALLSGTVLVDSKRDCLREAGELIGAGLTSKELTEIGDLIPTDLQGNIEMEKYEALMGGIPVEETPKDIERTFDGPVTIFKSVGLGIQDVAIASAVVEKALDQGKGISVAGYDRPASERGHISGAE
ncbi:hypothetical protein CPB83DRAFT_877535 [Crepidotus variabilis]|uniref:Ornithine cyclodeaminase n=1 Tax=Crepidotus variabilis TaxID=179855 RepID=A0A9P6E964_9AGAR|nr:hypothetical protein CPB83DRAFT_877535 [Crepidotus variabilis]